MDRLPQECYQFATDVEQIAAESDQRWGVIGIEAVPKKGTFVHLTGASFPVKCYTGPEALFAANMVKALFIESIKSFTVAIGLNFLTGKGRQKMIDSFNRIGLRIMSPYILKYHFLSEFSQELHQFIFSFLMSLKIRENSADQFATIFVHLIEYDNAYRLRIEDMFSVINPAALLWRPIREMNRIMKVYESRDIHFKGSKYQRAFQLSLCLLFIPKVRKALRQANLDTDFSKLSLDEIDTYWVCMRQDYMFLGKTYEERQELFKEKGWVMPTQIK